MVEVDKAFADEYNKKLSDYKDKDVRDADIKNKFNGQGGFALIAYNDGTFSVDIDFSASTDLELKKGVIATFDKKYKIKDVSIGGITDTNYNYKFSIINNSFVVEGTGKLNTLNQEFFSNPPQTSVGLIDDEVLDGLCYIYHYDQRNRLIEKRVPGKGWEYIVYNKVDLPVLTQDQFLRTDNKWLFSKYDIYGRIIYTGEYSFIPNGSDENSGRKELRDIINSQTSEHYESFLETTSSSVDNLSIKYTNDSYPNTGLTLYSVNYYDNYIFPVEDLVFTDSFEQDQTTRTKSLNTGSQVRILDSDDWIYTRTYYDDQARPIYIVSKNEYLNTFDIIRHRYNNTGRLLETETSHTKGDNNPIVISDEYTYDSQGRLLTQIQILDGHRELIANNKYDELGKLETKKVGGDIANVVEQSAGLQSIDYHYNINGWLKSINEGNVVGDDLFGFKLNYNNPEVSGTKKLYNGNISETHWMTVNDDVSRNYKYDYDAMNRIVDATFTGGTLDFPNNVSASPTQDENYSLKDVQYDKNGNILHIERYGIHLAYAGTGSNQTTDIVDGLDYFYENNSNKLLNVTDFADNGFNFGAPNIDNGGFLEKHETGNKYEYYDNGNLKKDLNKSIDLIVYNHLNLPISIYVSGSGVNGGGVIHYTYDAAGLKLSKEVSFSNGSVNSTYYSNIFVYQNHNNIETLKFFNHPEGYVEPDGVGGYDYVYQYKDHLGNIRLSYVDKNDDGNISNSEIIEESNYYPFGLKHKGYNNVINGTDHSYGFGGKEENDELGLAWHDFGARNYDGSLGRWMNLDPLADKYTRISPYAYVANTPIMAIDPDGKKILFVNGFYNSYVGGLFGASKRGREYWSSGFSRAAQSFFNDHSSLSNYNYIDGSSVFGGDSSGKDREQAGYEYAEANYQLLIKGMEDDETFKIVTHSEGGAFGAGIARYLQRKKHKVETIVHLSSDEGDEFDTPFGPDTYQLGYSGDWVTGNKEIDNVSVFAIIDKFESDSDEFKFAHGSTKGPGVFKELKSLIKAIKKVQGTAIKVTETDEGVKFEIVRTYKQFKQEDKD